VAGSAIVAMLLAAALLPAASGKHQPTPLELANQSLQQGQLDDSVRRLQALLGPGSADADPSAGKLQGQAYLLLCRAHYAEEQTEEAVAACERSADKLHSSESEDWLGRAEGMKAGNAGPISGFNLARKVKAAFEEAVALDPHSGDAINDLSEYYVNAPAIVGGGVEKADALADRVAADLPQQAHRIRAIAAEKRRDYGTAEREYRAAVSVHMLPNAWADLGGYYSRHKQEDKAIDALKQCLAADRMHDASIVDAASILNEMHREPQLEEQMLRLYLAGNAKTDAAPVVRVHLLLGQLLAANGDKARAKIEFQASLDLAANYAPARKALHDL
jgi:tetratricopeptide (TPR) repeat protein